MYVKAFRIRRLGDHLIKLGDHLIKISIFDIRFIGILGILLQKIVNLFEVLFREIFLSQMSIFGDKKTRIDLRAISNFRYIVLLCNSVLGLYGLWQQLLVSP